MRVPKGGSLLTFMIATYVCPWSKLCGSYGKGVGMGQW